ncbi:MAG: Uncharacterised protein [Flavobacteriales bacterium UBA4585]|nr:MAG: Uncharacterised protein [Flavobacteriales bacterium UBA4585]
MNRLQHTLLLVFIGCAQICEAQVLAVFKYDGGGDWYANPTALKNLSAFYNKSTDARSSVRSEPVTAESLLASGVSFLHGTGHGRIILSKDQANQLRAFTENGGFLHIDDNYGMSTYAKEALKQVFPTATIERVSHDHPIFYSLFPFPKGMPKIHEHDNGKPEAIGYFVKGELVALLTLETDLGDGWEDAEVHADAQEKREAALKMGANLLHWATVRNQQP